MFVCKKCKSVDKYELMFSKTYKGNKVFEQKIDDKNELIFVVDGYVFKPDIAFMNRHAICRYCGNAMIWDYE